MRDIFSEIFQTLRNNRLRTILTGLSVSWGIFMLIVLLALARGQSNSFREDITDSGKGSISIYGGVTSKPFKGNREGRNIQFEVSDLRKVKEENPSFVGAVSSEIEGSVAIISSGGKSITEGYTGVTPASLGPEIKLLAGRLLNGHDVDARGKVALLPMNYVNALFPGDSIGALGKRITLNGISFRIVGIYSHRWMRNIYIPFTTARLMQADKEKLGTIKVDVENLSTEADGMEAEQDLRGTMAKSHGFSAEDESAVYISNQFLGNLMAEKGFSIFDTGIWVLGLLTLISGIVGVSNIMFVSVRERTHEIGIRRAIGARPRQILLQIVSESVAITVIFGYIGIVAATLVTQLLAQLLKDVEFISNPTVNFPIALEVTFVLIIAGALAGLSPAMRALKIKPVEALRDE